MTVQLTTTTKNRVEKKILSRRERSALIASIVIMVGTLPLTYIFFLLPLLGLPIALLDGLVLAGIIRNKVVIRAAQILSALGVLLTIWVVIILLSYAQS